MNAEEILKAITQTVLLSIETHINKMLDEKLEAFRSQLTGDLSHSEFDKLIQNWLENHNITTWVNGDDLDLESAMDAWFGNNVDIGSVVDEYISNHFDIDDMVKDAVRDLSFEVSVR